MVDIDTWPHPSLLMRGCPAVGGLSHYMSDLRIINSICLWGAARWRPWCVTANCVSVNWWPAECEDTMWHQSDTTLIQHNNTHIATLTNIFNKLQMFQGSSQKTRQKLFERKLFSIFSYPHQLFYKYTISKGPNVDLKCFLFLGSSPAHWSDSAWEKK